MKLKRRWLINSYTPTKENTAIFSGCELHSGKRI